jgi:hypothetical protein
MSTALLVLPRKWAALPLLATACYMTRVGVDLGVLSFTVLRILLCVGLIRVVLRNERPAGRLCALDGWMVAWAIWLIASVTFHKSPGDQLVTRLGNLLDAGGLYFLFRTFVSSKEDIRRLLLVIPFLLIPLAVLMLAEKALVYNFFSVFGGVPDTPVVRAGKVRAQGPFDVSILAGTIAAGCVPLVLGLWPWNRLRVVIGLAAAAAMIYACTSSGPILTAAWAVFGVAVWRFRAHMQAIRWGAVAFYFVLLGVMKDPPYFIMAKIDLTGSSTGWHRAEIIRAASNHFSEWWLIGTDRTIHWMPYGIAWSADHTDITNHYLQMGVLGGVLLMTLFVGSLVSAFSALGRGFHDESEPYEWRWMYWTLGAALFSHAVTFLSVAYYDQSMVFLYMNLAIAACVALTRASTGREIERQSITVPWRSSVPTPGKPGRPSKKGTRWNPSFAPNVQRSFKSHE